MPASILEKQFDQRHMFFWGALSDLIWFDQIATSPTFPIRFFWN